MNFLKIQALGNDFVIWGTPSNTVLPDEEAIRFLCDRHYGIGADSAVYIARSNNADYAMHIYNPDGFEAEMCGNALKCSMQYCIERGFFNKRCAIVETKSGLRSVYESDGLITAEIGKATILEKGVLNIAGLQFPYRLISVGNPHCVIFTDEAIGDEFPYIASAIENHPNFPNKTNVEFARYLDDNTIDIRIWERGIGETLSCVTGSCACVEAVVDQFNLNGKFKVKQAGGIVEVDRKECRTAFVTGKCETVYKGTII